MTADASQEGAQTDGELTPEELERAESFFGKNKLVSGSTRVQPLPTHLQLADNIKYHSWVDIGRSIVEVRKSTHFWIGDWLVYGSLHYGERFSQGASELGLKSDTLTQYAYVSRAYTPAERNPSLTWRHHQIVAGEGDHEVRQELLKHAEDNKLTTRELLKHYQTYRNELAGTPQQEEKTYCCPDCGTVIKESQLNEILMK